MPKTVTIIRLRFLEDDVYEGDIPQAAHDDAWERREVTECENLDEAVRLLRSEGLTFEGADWASDPEGSFITNYATAEREMRSGHLDGWSADEVAIIVDAVNDDDPPCGSHDTTTGSPCGWPANHTYAHQ